MWYNTDAVAQWCNIDAVLKWFNNITDKSNCSFIQFNIKESYLSTSENNLQQTLKFAKQCTNIDKITHALPQIVTLLYIHSLSKYPPNVIKQISNFIQERLPRNSSNDKIFNTAKCEYEDALKKSGFKVYFK